MRATRGEDICDARNTCKLQQEDAYDALSIKKNTGDEHRDTKEDAYDTLNIKKHTGEELRDANIMYKQQEENIVVTRETIEEEIRDAKILHEQQ